jgi:hypothetical protein
MPAFWLDERLFRARSARLKELQRAQPLGFMGS